MSQRSIILNTFKPNSEILNPNAFAGRVKEIKKLTNSLYVDNSCPMIFGDKGLGKTSLAAQVARIALGDVELLRQIGLAKLALPKTQRFVPVKISCSDAIKTKDEILQRIVNTSESYFDLEELSHFELNGKQKKKKINLKIFESETVKNYNKIDHKSYSKLNMEDKLCAIIDTMFENGVNKVLFIIDELDRVEDTKGLANFIKNVSSDSIKFLLVGISQDISSLLSDHASIERNLVPVKVSRMGNEDLKQIITKALIILESHNLRFEFDKAAVDLLAKSAAGFPWFVHVLGSEALREAWEKGTTKINRAAITLAINELSDNHFAQQFSDDYQKAVRDSVQREIVLRLFAEWRDEDIPTSEIYKYARILKVKNPSGCKKDLMDEKHGNVLLKKPGHTRGIVRFRNSMFKRYVNMRSSVYVDADEKVKTLYNAIRTKSEI